MKDSAPFHGLAGARPRRSVSRAATALLMAAAVCGGVPASLKTAGASGARASGACPVTAPASSTTINVLAYSSPSVDPFSNAMASGCSGVSNLTVNHSPVDFSAQLQKGQLSLSQGNASYDIVEVYNSTLNQYAASGWLQPLDSLFARYKQRFNLGDIDPTYIKGFRYKGTLYGLPMEINVHEMIYRKDILQSLGLQPPRTFDQLVAACTKIQQSGKVRHCLGVPFSADVYISSAFNNALTSLGGQWVDPATYQPQLTQPKAKAAIQALRRLLPFMGSDAMASGEASITAQEENGAVAMAIMYSGSIGEIDDPSKSRFAGKFGFAAAPSVLPGGKPYATLFTDGFALARNSKVSPDLLFQVAAVGTGQAAARSAGILAYPTRDSVLKDPQLSSKALYWLGARASVDAGAHPPPAQPFLATLQATVRPFIAAAVSGQTPVDSALAQAQTAAVAFMKHGGYLK